MNSIWLHMFHWWCFLFFYQLKQLKKLIPQKKVAPTSKIQMTNYIIGLYPFFDFFMSEWKSCGFCTLRQYMAPYWGLVMLPLFLTPQASKLPDSIKKSCSNFKSWIDHQLFWIIWIFWYFGICKNVKMTFL